MIATTWGTGQALWDIVWFFLFIIEIYLMFTIFVDLFRRHDIKGWLKALWVLAIIVVPLIGILAYLIVYGSEMRVHAQQAAQDQQEAFRHYVQHAAGTGGPATELTRLHELKEKGAISDEEYDHLKSRIINAN